MCEAGNGCNIADEIMKRSLSAISTDHHETNTKGSIRLNCRMWTNKNPSFPKSLGLRNGDKV
jgi:hypothetical protein